MLKIGLTGGIGSGKSTVGHIFHQIGIPVFYSDIEAKKLVMTDAYLLREIKTLFGEGVFNQGILDNKKLGQKVFNNKELLSKLNKIIHPAVRAHFREWVQQQGSVSYILNESAIIFEQDLHRELDAVIVVLAPEHIRIKRVAIRDGIQEHEVLQRIRNQISDAERKQKGTYFIMNDEMQPVIPQVLTINKLLVEKEVRAK
jgi:dephospho-CoA kinase